MSPQHVPGAQKGGDNDFDSDDEDIRPTRNATVYVTYGRKTSPRTKRVSDSFPESYIPTGNKEADRSRNKIVSKSKR